MNWLIRLATPADIPRISELIDASVRGLQAPDYTPAQIDGALRAVYGVDTQLIADGTYYVVDSGTGAPVIVGCGGWSKRKTLYGGDACQAREDSLLRPPRDAARTRFLRAPRVGAPRH